MDNNNDVLKQEPKIRRYDIDWLRILVFWLLIIFHVAVGFVPWGVYSYQNNQSAGIVIELFLLYTHQWRLPLLFVISGMGTCFALKRRTGKQFIKERTTRLLIPLLFGMNFINIFQGYYSAQHYGKVESLMGFVIEWWSHLGEWQHLWFLVNLFIYSLICAPLFLHLLRKSDSKIIRATRKIFGIPNGLGLLFIVPVPLIFVELLIKPWSYGFTGLGYEFVWYLVFFIIGYLCIRVGNVYWKTLDKIRISSLLLGIICSGLLFGIMILGDIISPGYGELLINGGWLLYGDKFWGVLSFPAIILHSLNAWFWCLTIFSWGARFLNKPSKRLAYLNHGVYPFYIVHMTFILIILFYIKDVEIVWPLKLLFITGVTFLGCWIIFEIVKRNKVTRMLFGIKSISTTDNNKKK